MPIAYWCVLVAGVMPVLVVGFAKWGPGLDNHLPRDWAGGLTGARRRAYAAHQNCFEAFPFFATAVLVAASIDGRSPLLDGLALTFVAARIAYVAFYLADLATARSIAWTIGWFVTIAIFVIPAI